MSRKHKADKSGYVYSTDPNFRFNQTEEEQSTLEPARQKLRVSLETKQRGGKTVTVIEDFVGSTVDREALGKQLKNLCGTGGSVKQGEILIQGDHREKILRWLIGAGYAQTRKKGG